MDLTSGSLTQHIRTIAIPASLGFFFNTMFNVVDTYFAGWISTQALAALSITFPVFFIIVAFVQGVSTGSAALIANAIGSKNEDSIELTSAQVMTFAVLCYFFVVPIVLLTNRSLFEILGAEGEYLEMAVSYMNYIYFGSFFFILLYAANSTLLARGNSKVLRNYLVAGFFVNMVLNPLFIFGGWGIEPMGFSGIAMATVVTMCIGCFYVFWEVWRHGYLKVHSIRDFIPRKKIFLEIAEQSIPACLNMMTIGMGVFVITFFTKDFGQAAVATYGIGVRIEQIALLPTIGLTISALSIIGQNNGAGNYDRIEETIRLTLIYGSMIILVGCLFMIVFSHQIFQFFTNDPHVVSFGSIYLHIAALTSWAYLILGIHVSALQGMKKPLYPLVIGLARQIVFPVFVFYLVTKSFKLGVESIWWSICVITWSAAIITFFYTWRVIKKLYIQR